jgi:hypothetical protein
VVSFEVDELYKEERSLTKDAECQVVLASTLKFLSFHLQNCSVVFDCLPSPRIIVVFTEVVTKDAVLMIEV